MIPVVTQIAEETHAFGAKLAAQLLPGDVVLLLGQMGAGKSVLARGIAIGLGITETITSPTYTILQVYDSGRLPFYHFDWYRIRSAEEIYELSMEEYLGGNGIAVIEWPERAEKAIPTEHLRIAITPIGINTRKIMLKPMGSFHSLAGQPLQERALIAYP